MTAIITFFVSLVGITILIAFKVWEAHVDAPKLARVRSRADVFLAENEHLLRTHVPEKSLRVFKNLLRGFMHYARMTVHTIVRLLSRRFAFITTAIRGRGTIKRDGTVSAFLRNVTDHKKNINRDNLPL